MITGNEIAMPEIITDLEANGLNNTYSYGGLTIRQEFAARAMQGLMAVENKGTADWNDLVKTAARIAVQAADALIEELNK